MSNSYGKASSFLAVPGRRGQVVPWRATWGSTVWVRKQKELGEHGTAFIVVSSGKERQGKQP